MNRPFQPRPVFLADSFMLPVGKNNGKPRPQSTLLLFSTNFNKQKYRFLIGVDPQAAASLKSLAAGEKIELRLAHGELRVNDVPIRRFYRKTIEGVVELADNAFRQLRRKK